MVNIQLKSDEAAILREILGSDLSDLRMEIANTDSMDYREILKAREAFLKRLLQTLQE